MTATNVDNPALAAQHQADLAEVIQAYNQVTERLQRSHERLKGEVLRLRRELASTNAQLQRSRRLSALGEMAAGIAHEIRNPLSAIQLYAQMARDDLGKAAQREAALAEAAGHAEKIVAAVRGLDGIVNDVLSFAREIEPRPVPIDAHEALHRAVDAHRPAIESAAADVRVIEASRPIELRADADLLHQALLNLVRNAVDAMAEVDRRVLTLSAARDEQGVCLRVADTGPGIEPADIDRIFNPFFTTRDAGTGLGLAIVHRIVDAHNGAIVADNAAEGGAVFELHLPRSMDKQGERAGLDGRGRSRASPALSSGVAGGGAHE